MNTELKLHIKKLQNRAIFSLIATLLSIISIGFGILLLFVPSLVSVVFIAIAVISVVYLIYGSKMSKKEMVSAPVIFNADSDFSFEEIVCAFESLTDEKNKLSLSEDVLFFRFDKIFKLRTVLYRTNNFSKKEFDNSKDRINKKANKELEISHWVNSANAGKMMRFNIICSNSLNDELYKFISQNANRNLSRVEGIINIAVVQNQILIPPIYGECDLAEISRYKGVVKFINKVLLKKNK